MLIGDVEYRGCLSDLGRGHHHSSFQFLSFHSGQIECRSLSRIGLITGFVMNLDSTDSDALMIDFASAYPNIPRRGPMLYGRLPDEYWTRT